ncbi:MAG TPA: hypothetical protein VGR62_20590 [Candidatus Binatia bacterium]|jgi:hypothetical protein|nr:hypothetical protein [Candidatus Binatia bacterium]
MSWHERWQDYRDRYRERVTARRTLGATERYYRQQIREGETAKREAIAEYEAKRASLAGPEHHDARSHTYVAELADCRWRDDDIAASRTSILEARARHWEVPLPLGAPHYRNPSMDGMGIGRILTEDGVAELRRRIRTEQNARYWEPIRNATPLVVGLLGFVVAIASQCKPPPQVIIPSTITVALAPSTLPITTTSSTTTTTTTSTLTPPD